MTFEPGAGRIQGQLPPGSENQVGAFVVRPTIPGEPLIGSVVQFKIMHGQRVYDYAAIRAGDGKWYATGETKQGVTWDTMVNNIRPKIVGPLWVLSGRTGYTL